MVVKYDDIMLGIDDRLIHAAEQQIDSQLTAGRISLPFRARFDQRLNEREEAQLVERYKNAGWPQVRIGDSRESDPDRPQIRSLVFEAAQ